MPRLIRKFLDKTCGNSCRTKRTAACAAVALNDPGRREALPALEAGYYLEAGVADVPCCRPCTDDAHGISLRQRGFIDVSTPYGGKVSSWW